MKKEQARTTLELVSSLREFRSLVPWSECRRILGWNRSSLVTPAVLTCSIALLDAAVLLLLVPLLSLLAGADNLTAGWSILQELSRSQVFFGLAGLLCLFGIGKAYLAYILHAWTGRFYENTSEKLSNYLFTRYLSFGKAYFQQTSQGKLWDLLNKRHDLLSLFVGLQRLVVNSTLLLTHLAILLFISWPLALVLSFLVPFFYLSLEILARRYGQLTARSRESISELYPKAYRIYAGIDLYRNYCREELAEREFTDCNAQIREASLSVWILSGMVERVREIAALVCIIILLLLTSRLVTERPDLLMSYLVFFFVVKNSLPLMGTFQQVALEFHQKLPAAREFLEVFSDTGKHLVEQGTREFEPPKEGFDIKDLGFRYPEGAPVLRNLTCRIPAGKTTALVGASGAGKSTLLQLLVRNYEFQEGSLEADGVSLREFTHHSIRGRTAYLQQEPHLFRDSVRANLNFGLREEQPDCTLMEILASVGLEEWVFQLPEGLDTLLGDGGSTVSAGQRQRLALARDLVRDSQLFLIDEATSSLDKSNELEVRKLIARATKNKTTVIVTHKLDSLSEVDQILVLQDGAVVQQGTYLELTGVDGPFNKLRAVHNE